MNVRFQILQPSKLRSCAVSTQTPISSKSFNYFKDTKSFYSSMTTSAGLSTSLQADFSLSFTLDSSSKGISGFDRTVTGSDLLIMASVNQTMLNKDCIQRYQLLDQTFLADFQNLPTNIPSPWESGSWIQYDAFLKKHGSHVVTSITYGASISQMAFADTSDSYSERDFQVKSCLALAGPTDVGKLNVSICSGIDKSEITRVSSMSISDNLVVRGGTDETRNQLILERSAELIDKFMNEATTTNTPIKYSFTSVWDLLQGAFVGINQANFIRAVNLEYYFLGYLNYGCDYRTTGGQDLQLFNFTSGANAGTPQYQCTIAPKGCHSDNDCHYKPIWCSCKGASCIALYEVPLDTGSTKTVAQANTDSDWGWQGCDWKKGAAGFKCICRHENKERMVVWSRDNKDAMYHASFRMMEMMEGKKDGTKEEL